MRGFPTDSDSSTARSSVKRQALTSHNMDMKPSTKATRTRTNVTLDYFTASLNHRTMKQYAAQLGIPLPFLVARLRMLRKSSNNRLQGAVYSKADLFDLNKEFSLEQVLAMRSPAFTANFQEQDTRSSIILANERTITHTRRAPAWSLTGVRLRSLPLNATLVEAVRVMKHAHPDLRGLGFKNFQGSVNQVLECAPFLRIEKLHLSGSGVQGDVRAFARLVHLTVLKLAKCCELRGNVAAFANLVNLTSLHLYGCSKLTVLL